MLDIVHFIRRTIVEPNLNIKDNLEISKRGFLIKNGYGNSYLFAILFQLYLSLFIIVGFGTLIGSQNLGISSGGEGFTLLMLGIVILSFSFKWLFYSIKLLRLYLHFPRFYFSEKGVIAFGKVTSSSSQIDGVNVLNRGRKIFWNIIDHIRESYINIGTVLYLLFIIAFLLYILIDKYFIQSIFIILSTILFFVIFKFVIEFLQSFHPLYAFGNLGEKIQKLTPKIEEQSKEIQKNFQEDMNFQVLSEGFDSLSSTFSQIVTLVIKLEKIETKANKGNIFDSEKYINSLRVDILVPLKSLKSFLETQKEELGKSHGELKIVRVRVGGVDPSLGSGGQEQKELASKRSESLLMELTENIERLDTMIQKIA